MSQTITLQQVSLSTPDDRPLFTNLDLSFTGERAGLIGQNGIGKSTILRLICGEVVPQKGKVTVDGKIGILRQNLRPQPGLTLADLFGVSDDLARLDRIQRGIASDEDLEFADWNMEAKFLSALDRVKLAVSPSTLLSHLSGGQLTRAALAALWFAEPDFILLDEPTNHLDREGRLVVIEFLSKWRKGAVVVSHDRELLGRMHSIIELTALGAARYGGNWEVYRAQKEAELAAAQHDLAHTEKRAGLIERASRVVSERKARRDSAGRQKAARNDNPRINQGRLKDRAENSGAAVSQVFEQRLQEARLAAAEARKKIDILQPLTIKLPTAGLPAGKAVMALDRVTAGYQADIPILRDLSFTLVGPERVAVTGPNGCGKSTLLAVISGALPPLQGRVSVHTSFAFLDQRVEMLDPALSIRENFRRVHPDADENACRAALARFMFRSDAALQTAATLSGGQLLRAGLACALGGAQPPQFLILDEPTNHLDLKSIAAVETGLREYDGALLVVSHDEMFLKSIRIDRTIELPPRWSC